MIVPSHAELIEQINAFLERHPGIGESRFGREVCGEPGLIARIRKGSSPTLNMLERIATFMIDRDREAAVEHGAEVTVGGGDRSSGNAHDISTQVAA